MSIKSWPGFLHSADEEKKRKFLDAYDAWIEAKLTGEWAAVVDKRWEEYCKARDIWSPTPTHF